MAYEYLLVGTQRFTQNGYIGSTNPNYATRIYNVSVYGSSTSATGIVVLASGTGERLTTVSAMGTAYIVVAPTNSSTTYCWDSWDSHYGILLDGPALFITGTGIIFATVAYQKINR